MIVLQHGVAYGVTCDNLLSYLDRAAAGHVESLDQYAMEVGEWGGDVSSLAAKDADLLARAIRARLVDGLEQDSAVEDADAFADRVVAICEEERMLVLAFQQRQVA